MTTGFDIPSIVNGPSVSNSPLKSTAGISSGGMSVATGGALLAGGLSFISNLTSNYVNAKTAGMLADSYRTQARLAILQANQQNAYLNEQGAQQVWNLYDQQREMLGTQTVAMGASGFDVSSGDQRLLQDTKNKIETAASGINRSMFLQAFETTRAARMEASRLNYAAQSQELIRKQYSGLSSILNTGTSAGLNALGAYASLKQPSARNGNIGVDGSFKGLFR